MIASISIEIVAAATNEYSEIDKSNFYIFVENLNADDNTEERPLKYVK